MAGDCHRKGSDEGAHGGPSIDCARYWGSGLACGPRHIKYERSSPHRRVIGWLAITREGEREIYKIWVWDDERCTDAILAGGRERHGHNDGVRGWRATHRRENGGGGG